MSTCGAVGRRACAEDLGGISGRNIWAEQLCGMPGQSSSAEYLGGASGRSTWAEYPAHYAAARSRVSVADAPPIRRRVRPAAASAGASATARMGYSPGDGSGHDLPDHGKDPARWYHATARSPTRPAAMPDPAGCIHKNHILINTSHVLLRKIKPLLRTCKRQHAATDEIFHRSSEIIRLWDDSHFGLLFGFGP